VNLEYVMKASLGAVDSNNTTVVTTVHDCQVFNDLPDYMFGEQDLNVDMIDTDSSDSMRTKTSETQRNYSVVTHKTRIRRYANT
jgi:hypothetical protein